MNSKISLKRGFSSTKKVNPGRTKRGLIVYRIYRDYSKINVCLNGITITAYEDEVTPLILPAEIDVTEQTAESETVPTETTAAPTATTITETTIESSTETTPSSETADSASAE